jgi:hypothetical protein
MDKNRGGQFETERGWSICSGIRWSISPDFPYKSLILRNDLTYVRRIVHNILRDIESSLSQDKYIRPGNGRVYADLSQHSINCLNVSDTIILWTKDDTLKSFMELLRACYRFNWQEIDYSFPIRGALFYGEIELIHGSQKNDEGGTYMVNLIYGKGLVQAHLKAECLNFAGTVIDESVLTKISEFGNPHDLLSDYALLYKVPYKESKCDNTVEYVIRLTKGELSEESFKNTKESIYRAFYGDNKATDNPRIPILFDNTINFLEFVKKK